MKTFIQKISYVLCAISSAQILAAAQFTAPNVASSSYTSGPFVTACLVPQCTWYCRGRLIETGLTTAAQLDQRKLFLGHANTWADFDPTQSGGFTTGTTPRQGSIAVYRYAGSFGHVAFVEDVVDGVPLFTESNATPTTSPPATVVIGRDSNDVGGYAVRIRAEPKLTGALVGTLPKFSVCTVVDGPVSADGHTWFRLRGDAGDGWAALLEMKTGDPANMNQSEKTFYWNFSRIQLTPSMYSISVPNSKPDIYIYPPSGEIAVVGNGVAIASGSVTTKARDFTEFIGVPANGNSSSTREFVITNSGGANLAISGVSVAAGFFSIESGFPSSLTPNASSTLKVRFRPTAGALGYFSTTVTIKTNSPTNPVFTFKIGGAAQETGSSSSSSSSSGSSSSSSSSSGAAGGQMTYTVNTVASLRSAIDAANLSNATSKLIRLAKGEYVLTESLPVITAANVTIAGPEGPSPVATLDGDRLANILIVSGRGFRVEGIRFLDAGDCAIKLDASAAGATITVATFLHYFAQAGSFIDCAAPDCTIIAAGFGAAVAPAGAVPSPAAVVFRPTAHRSSIVASVFLNNDIAVSFGSSNGTMFAGGYIRNCFIASSQSSPPRPPIGVSLANCSGTTVDNMSIYFPSANAVSVKWAACTSTTHVKIRNMLSNCPMVGDGSTGVETLNNHLTARLEYFKNPTSGDMDLTEAGIRAVSDQATKLPEFPDDIYASPRGSTADGTGQRWDYGAVESVVVTSSSSSSSSSSGTTSNSSSSSSGSSSSSSSGTGAPDSSGGGALSWPLTIALLVGLTMKKSSQKT